MRAMNDPAFVGFAPVSRHVVAVIEGGDPALDVEFYVGIEAERCLIFIPIVGDFAGTNDVDFACIFSESCIAAAEIFMGKISVSFFDGR